jgi:hypothetical protein
MMSLRLSTTSPPGLEHLFTEPWFVVLVVLVIMVIAGIVAVYDD